MRNDALRAVHIELDKAGIRYKTATIGSGHLRVSWGNGPTQRRVTVSATPSDRKAVINNRALVRRLLRTDLKTG